MTNNNSTFRVNVAAVIVAVLISASSLIAAFDTVAPLQTAAHSAVTLPRA